MNVLNWSNHSKLLRLIAAAALSFTAFVLRGATIVDTGPGSNAITGTPLATNLWVAGEFTLAQGATINSAEAWLGNIGGGSAFAGIYQDNGMSDAGAGDAPGSLLFSSSFALPGGVLNPNGWSGVSGVNWTLPAGTYWVVFGTTSSSLFAFLPPGAASPLAQQAVSTNQGASWVSQDSSTFGFRILGEIAAPAVPENAHALSLLVLGLAALEYVRRRR